MPEDGEKLESRLRGKTLAGRYRVDECLGRGGMGAVFRATHLYLNKPVAVKVLALAPMNSSVDRQEFERRFQGEAQLASQIEHPHVARVVDFGIDGDLQFMVMDLLEGADLSDLLALEAPVAPARALLIVDQMLSALAAAAERRVVHRDIKPSNLRLCGYQPGGPIDLRILDWGLARHAKEPHRPASAGKILGTYAYIAPEQISIASVNDRYLERGGDPQRLVDKVDERADLYATGVVLYQLLSGRLPFQGPNQTLLVAHLLDAPPPLPPHLPAPLRRLTEHLLQKHPAERPQSAAAARALVAHCLETPRAAPSHRAAMVIALAGLGLLGVSWLQRPPRVSALQLAVEGTPPPDPPRLQRPLPPSIPKAPVEPPPPRIRPADDVPVPRQVSPEFWREPGRGGVPIIRLRTSSAPVQR